MVIDRRTLTDAMFQPTRTLTYDIARISVQHHFLQRDVAQHGVNVAAEVRAAADREMINVISSIYIGKRRFAVGKTKEPWTIKTTYPRPARKLDYLLLTLPKWFHRFVRYEDVSNETTIVVTTEQAEYYYVDPEIQMTRDGRATICRVVTGSEEAVYEAAKAEAEYGNALRNPTAYFWR